jgi:hypothetical protein
MPIDLAPSLQPFLTLYEQCIEYYPDERPLYATRRSVDTLAQTNGPVSLEALKEQLLDCAAGKPPVARMPIANMRLRRMAFSKQQ